MELKTYLEILNRRKLIILVSILVAVVIVFVGNFIVTPTYEASATLRVATAATDSVDYRYFDRLMNTYITIAVSEPVLDELKESQGIDDLAEIFINVESLPETELLKITAQTKTPEQAQGLANTLAQILIDQNQQLYVGGTKSAESILAEQLTIAEGEFQQAQDNYESLLEQSNPDPDQLATLLDTLDFKQQTYQMLLERYEEARLNEIVRTNAITIVEPASFPLAPAKPRKLLNLVLGALIGAVIGIGLAFLVDNLDTTIYSRGEIESISQVPILAEIPDFTKASLSPIKRSGDDQTDQSVIDEAFKTLRMRLLYSSDGSPPKTILITSAAQGEGKSTIVAKLGATMTQLDRSVAIADCDLHLPKQHKIWDIPNEVGLTNVLIDKVPLDEALQPTSNQGLLLLPSGPLNSQTSEMLGSPEMLSVIEQLAKQFDYVFFDTPSLLAVADASVLAQAVDQVILVVAQRHVSREALERTLYELEGIGISPGGIVINRSKSERRYYYYSKES